MHTDLTRIADELNAASAELAAATATLDRYVDTINVRGIFTAEQAKNAIASIARRCEAIGMDEIARQLEAAHMTAESIQMQDEAEAAERLDATASH